MPPFIFRCPYTGYRVQGYDAKDNESERADGAFVGVTCAACGQVHFVNPKTGKTPSENGE